MSAAAPLLGVLEATPPRFTPDQVADIAAELFGLHGSARDLGSERDQTFLVDDGAGGGGVLKISNLGEDPAVLDLECEALLHVARADPELPVAHQRLPLGRDAGDGAAAFRAQTPGPDGSHHVRLFERLHGRTFVPGPELDDGALFAFGATLARLARALRGFFHPAAGRTLLWDTHHAAALRPLAASIEEDRRRAMVERILGRYETRVAPAWPRLRAQVVHGDLALDNVLLDERGRVSGIVDFGDIVHTALAADLAAAIGSALRGRERGDVFRAARILLDGYASLTPLEPLELELLGDLLAARFATVVSISAWRVRRYPENADYILAWDGGTWPLIELFDELGPEAVARELGGPRPPAASGELARRRRRILGPALTGLTYAEPVHVARGEGVWLLDAQGRRLLDAYNNVPVVGHCHPRVTEAVVDQTRRLNTHARYLYEPLVELAERLVQTMPAGSGLDTVMLVNSGSEANDLAWRIARACTGGDGGLVSTFAYHGVTAAVSDLSPEEWPRGRRPDGVETLPVPEDVEAARGGVEAALGRLAGRGRRPAALYLDTGFTSDGIQTPPAAAVAALVEAARAAGALFVADEVQAGHGRTGEHLWSFAGLGLEPDLVTLGKPMGNGYPVAAVVARGEHVERFARETDFFSTFGGNPVAARAGLAVLDVIADERLVAHAARLGPLLRRRLEELRPAHPALGALRGRGLLTGIDVVRRDTGLPDAALAARIVDGLRDLGVLVGRTGPREHVLKIRPPLPFAEEHVELLAERLDRVLADLKDA